MEQLFANIVDISGKYITPDTEIFGNNFAKIIEKAKNYSKPVAIILYRNTHNRTAYCTPTGISDEPFWFNRAGAPRKPAYLKKRAVGVELAEWVIAELAALPGSRQANIQAAVIAQYNLAEPTHNRS